MKFILPIVFLFTITLIISCGSCKNTSDNKLESKIIDQNNPTAITENISYVTARVDKINFISETDFKINVTVLVVEEKTDRPSIAVPGNEYVLQPNFRYDDGKLLDNDVNASLKSLGKLEKGKTFKAEISLENQKGWFIQKVLAD